MPTLDHIINGTPCRLAPLLGGPYFVESPKLRGRDRFIAAQNLENSQGHEDAQESESQRQPEEISAQALRPLSASEAASRLASPLKGRERFVVAQERENARRKNQR